MADKSKYLENQDDQISAQKRAEQNRKRIATAAVTVAGVAAFILARKKIDLSKTFATQSKALGKSGNTFEGLDRFAISEIEAGSTGTISGMIRDFKALIKPLPSKIEQRDLATMAWRTSTHPGRHLSEIPEVSLDARLSEKMKGGNFFSTLWHGPTAPIAPGAKISLPGRTITSGEFGGVYAKGRFYRLSKEGKVLETVTGVKSGITGTTAASVESKKAFGDYIGNWKNRRDFYKRTMAPSKDQVTMEAKRVLLEKEMAKYGVKYPKGYDANKLTDPDVIAKLSDELAGFYATTGVAEGLPGSVSALFKAEKGNIEKNVLDEIERLVARNADKAHVKMLYKAHQIGNFFGIGPQFAGYQSGFMAKRGLRIREAFKIGDKSGFRSAYLDSGRRYAPRNFRYTPFDPVTQEEINIGGRWASGAKGKFFLHSREGGVKRFTTNLLEGTFFRQMEQTFGIGLSVKSNFGSRAVSSLFGSQKGSWGDYFSRNYVGGMTRLAVLGMGGYTTYKLIDYLARKGTGWGVTDLAGTGYVKAREFQQQVIDNIGLVEAAKKTERAFPGSINSPLARMTRLAAPYWASMFGAKVGGRTGAMVGLALGIATALLTWGDITQSPEELHRIYTGQQDVPIRKGRWWMLGKTPFGGGKIDYWRPHWYPLMRSRYKQRGQLWDSPEEEMANRGPLAPILAPLLTGKAWDPYAWEKKHYYDRPYPLTGELFEPTMPFSWLLNATIGRLVKPQRVMHPEYWGVAQGETSTPKTRVSGAAEALGYGEQTPEALLAKVDPNSNSWLIGEGAYSVTEQMGLRGYIFNVINKQLSGNDDFLPEGPVVQTASRATGYERGYWDLDLGDPQGATEFFRRVLPHRRRGIEEYNPIPNEMPDWLPGENYYINFKTGDPYTKVKMGEARLPGPGYESLHTLHSGIPGVYDAVDRFMVLSDIAPYSKERTHYAYLAKAMTRKDKFWNEKVMRKDRQRSALTKEFNFLYLRPQKDITGVTRTLSSAYRKTLEALGPGGLTGNIDQLISTLFTGMPIPLVESPISKMFPYRTPVQTYRDYRLYGSDFSAWDRPIEAYIKPFASKVRSTVSGTFVPEAEIKRREYEEYFDKLAYVKSKKLQMLAEEVGRQDLAKKFKSHASRTMVGVDETTSKFRLMGAIPKRERGFFDAFTTAHPEEREEIMQMVSPQMARIYQAQWAKRDTGLRARARTDQERATEVTDFFRNHHLPDDNWEGYNPDVDLRDVQIKTVRNEGMDIHKFDLWESQERSMARRPGVPEIEDIREETPSMSIDDLRRTLQQHMERQGYKNTKIHMVRTASNSDTAKIKIKVKKNREKERKEQFEEVLTY